MCSYLALHPFAEAVKVDIELKNPLQISISLSEVSLICELSESSESDGTKSGK